MLSDCRTQPNNNNNKIIFFAVYSSATATQVQSAARNSTIVCCELIIAKLFGAVGIFVDRRRRYSATGEHHRQVTVLLEVRKTCSAAWLRCVRIDTIRHRLERGMTNPIKWMHCGIHLRVPLINSIMLPRLFDRPTMRECWLVRTIFAFRIVANIFKNVCRITT